MAAGQSILLLVASLLIGGAKPKSASRDYAAEPPAKRRGMKRASIPLRPATAEALLLLALVPLHAGRSDKSEIAYKAGQYPEAEQKYQAPWPRLRTGTT